LAAGYSRRPLAQKLGIKQGQALMVLNPPVGYEDALGELPPGTSLTSKPKGGADLVHFFATRATVLDAEFPGLSERVKPGGAIWVSWPKASSKLPSDLTDRVVRDIGLKNGFVDVKVCAVDETWSGLKFVRRKVDAHARIEDAPQGAKNGFKPG